MLARNIANLAVKCGRTVGTSAVKRRSVTDAVNDISSRLEAAHVPEARVSASYLVAKILGSNNIELLEGNRQELSLDQELRLDVYLQCRLSRMPVQYIMGDWDFRQLTLQMRPPVFIPRPETEELVGHVLQYLAGSGSGQLIGLEVGCGSGAISLSLLHEFKRLRMLAVDQSLEACELTETNFAANSSNFPPNSLKIVNTKIDLEADDCGFQGMIAPQSLDFIVSNPPYVLRKDISNLADEIKIYEDLRALDGGKRGLDVIEPILVSADKFLKPGSALFLEVDPCHPYLVPQMVAERCLKLTLKSVIKDHQGKERFLILSKQ